MSIEPLETERLILREWKDEDRSIFARMNGDPMIMEHMPRALDEKASNKLVDRFQKHFKEHGYGLYACERKSDGAFMGFVGLETVIIDVPFKPAVEIAWRLDYEYWGHGYATEAAQRVLQHAFEELNLKEIVAFSVHDNARAIHIIEKLGMKRDPKGDFDYPGLAKGHPLGRFSLYRLKRKDYLSQQEAA